MTEYDYSPDAVERFHAKMDGVGKWARQQTSFAPKYDNPFLPEDALRSRPSSRQTTSPSPRRHDRPEPSRSKTLPVPAVGGQRQGQTSRAYVYAQQPGDSRAPQPSSRNHHRSGSQPPDARYPYPVAAPRVPHVSQTTLMAQLPPPPAGARQKVIYYDPAKPFVLPSRPVAGETYVIYPPAGGTVRAIPSGSSPHSRSSSRSQQHSQSSDGRKPLIKRLLTNLTNIEWGEGSRSGRSTRREGGRRRSTSR